MSSRRVCVIGAGPRGTSVVERICENVRRDGGESVVVHLVDPYPPGPGGVWRTAQSGYLLMNTVAAQISMFTDASVECDGPVVPGPSLYEWTRLLSAGQVDGHPPAIVLAEAARLGPHSYPSRAMYGHYLDWVFGQLVRNAPDSVTIRVHRATAIAVDDDPDGGQTVTLSGGDRLSTLDAVVLTLGHAPTVSDPEQDRLRSYADDHGLWYQEPANPADVSLDRLPPGEPVLVRGLGLNFFDYLTLLTVGRGGFFERTRQGLRYYRSGREPSLHVGSRRGVPYHARGENQKGAYGRHEPIFLTPETIAALRGAAVSFRGRVWPLIDREVRTVYYAALLGDQDFNQSYLDVLPDSAAESALLDRHRVPTAARWDWDRIERPYGDRDFVDGADFTAWLLDYLRADVTQAKLGNVTSPLKAALDVLRDLRNEIRQVVDHGGIAGGSYRDELRGWYTPLNAFASIGPPARRIEELIALMDAGVVRTIGPRPRIRLADNAFLVDSEVVADPPIAVRAVIEARVPDSDLSRSANPLLRYLLATGGCRSYRIADPESGFYETGALAVTQRPYRLIDADGRAHPNRFALGVPTEGVHWVTAAGIRPGVGSVTLSDTDAIARAALAAAELPMVA